MKTIKVPNLHGIPYPLGSYINSSLPTIFLMADTIKKYYGGKKISLWCRGSSGAIISGIIASRVDNCIICHIKKQREYSHASTSFDAESEVNIIVDDFIETGETIREIHKQAIKTVRKIDCIIVSAEVYKKSIGNISDVLICQSCIK